MHIDLFPGHALIYAKWHIIIAAFLLKYMMGWKYLDLFIGTYLNLLIFALLKHSVWRKL